MFVVVPWNKVVSRGLNTAECFLLSVWCSVYFRCCVGRSAGQSWCGCTAADAESHDDVSLYCHTLIHQQFGVAVASFVS